VDTTIGTIHVKIDSSLYYDGEFMKKL
jgi:hypothetical protein